MRKIKFENNHYYHIYNRGVDKRDVFMNDKDFGRFILSLRGFNVLQPVGGLYEKSIDNKLGMSKLSFSPETEFVEPKLVDIICYCLNKNHYHLIIKQLIDQGVEKFMHKLGLGYTKYFNQQHKRSGVLFEGRYNAKHIDTEKYLVWLSGYVNGNPEIHKISEAKNYKWSSYQDYLNIRKGTICDKNIILSFFDNNIIEYENFVKMVINDSSSRKDSIKEYLNGIE